MTMSSLGPLEAATGMLMFGDVDGHPL